MTAESFDAINDLGALKRTIVQVERLIVEKALDADAVGVLLASMEHAAESVRDLVEHPVIEAPDPVLAAGASAMLAAGRAATQAEQAERRQRAGLSLPHGSPGA